jgi:type I restriction enzyme S subunit
MKWEKMPIGELASITMGQSPTGDTYNKIGDGLPLLNGPTEFGDYYPVCTQFTVDSKRESQIGDLIFCVRGSTTGKMNWSDQIYSLGRGVCSIRGENQLKTKYIKYCLDTYLDGLLQLAGGGTFPNLSKNDINGFEIPYNSKIEEIASILSAYDDLIENNLKRIKLLEEAAFSTYKQLDRLNKFKLSELYDTSAGGTPSRTNSLFFNGDINWFKSKELADSILLESEEKITEEAVEKSSAKIFPAHSVIMAMYGATIGKLGILSAPSTTNQACCAIIQKDSIKSNFYIFNWLLDNREYILSFRMGAAQENISQQVIKNLIVTIPNDDELRIFNLEMEPIYKLIKNIHQQNNKLREARDILLPRLMSGEMEV